MKTKLINWFIRITIFPKHSGDRRVYIFAFNIFFSFTNKPILNFRPSSQSLQKITREKNIAIIMSKLFVRSNKYNAGVHGLSQSMFSNNLEMIVERGFPLLRKINNIISTMRDMGMMSKFLKDFSYNTTILARIRNQARQSKGRKITEDIDAVIVTIDEDDGDIEDEDPRIVLTVEHLEGGFTLLIVGYVISGTVFLIEYVTDSNPFKICKKILRKIYRNLGKKNYKKKVYAKQLRKANRYKIKRRVWKSRKKRSILSLRILNSKLL